MPLLPLSPPEQPWHSSQYPALPEVYIQNASLEVAWSRVVLKDRTIAGNVVMPFFTRDHEGIDVNHPTDWQVAEELVHNGQAVLPSIPQLSHPAGKLRKSNFNLEHIRQAETYCPNAQH